MAVGNVYQGLLEAVRSYYGAGSNEWLAIAQYGLQADNAAAILKQVPGVSTQIAKDGRVLSYSLDSNITINDGGTALSAINSNVQSGTASATNTITTKTVGTMTKDATTGAVNITSQIPKKTNGVAGTASAIAGTVSTTIAGASIGLSLGKTINSALSASDPNFWNKVTSEPEEGTPAWEWWKKITDSITSVDPDGKVQNFLNGLVGWDANGNTQTYLSEDAYAYYAYMLAREGFFSSGDPEIIPPPATNQPFSYYTPQSYDDFANFCRDMVQYTTPAIQTSTLQNVEALISVGRTHLHDHNYNVFGMDSSFSITLYELQPTDVLVKDTTYSGGVIGLLPRSYVNRAAYDEYGRVSYSYYGPFIMDTSQVVGRVFSGNISWKLAPSVPGIGDQPGATTPNTSTWDSPSNTLTSLQQQYPDLWDNAYEVTTIDDEGNEHTTRYLPVPIPEGYDDNKDPVGGDTSNQQNPDVDPDDATDDMLKTIIDLLTLLKVTPQSVTDPESETDDGDQTTDPNPPDIGDGSTPPVIVPTGSATALWSVYNPTQQDINDLGSWLWSTNFVTQLLQMFNDPMQAIIGLHKTFITPAVGPTQNIKVGYLDSGISSLTVPTQYSTMNCGSVNLAEYFGNVFDYTPYTRVYIYLPFIGFRELDVSQVMRSSIGVVYHGDAYTGACLAEISVTRDNGAGGVLYTYGGDCAVRYPLSHGSYMGIVNAIASLGVGAAGAALGAGGLGLMGGLSAFQNARLSVEHSGSFDGCSGAMGIKKPYLVVMRPQTAMPSNYKHFSGQPSSSLVQIAETSGLIRVRECHVDEIPNATKEEKDMIDKALHEGILVS